MPWGREHIYIYASLDLGNSWHVRIVQEEERGAGYMFHVRFTDQYIVRDDGIKCSFIRCRTSLYRSRWELMNFVSGQTSRFRCGDRCASYHCHVNKFWEMYETLYACRRSGMVLGFYDVVWIYYPPFTDVYERYVGRFMLHRYTYYPFGFRHNERLSDSWPYRSGR
jgi:hypothetical protein